MSIFDYPRVNFKGQLQLNPGTANNEDYAAPGPSQALIPSTFPPPYAGQPFGLLDSKQVTARTFGMSDEEFIAWVQKVQPFDTPSGKGTKLIPAEWNYYGTMGSNIIEARVVGVQSKPGADPLTDLLGAKLDFSGNITDVNAEGSPPATQFFIGDLTLTSADGQAWIKGADVSKGVGQCINFFRNVNQQADNGSGTYVYHVLRGGQVNIPGFTGPGIAGIILRYYLALPLLENPAFAKAKTAEESNEIIEALYEQQKTNAKTLEIVGTFAPLFKDEHIVAAPVGRQLISMKQNIPTPGLPNNNGGGQGIALGPAVIHQDRDRITADFIGTFPNNYDETTKENPKYVFGDVLLYVSAEGKSGVIGEVDYQNTAAGDQRGWLFDFDISANAQAQELLANPDSTLHLLMPDDDMGVNVLNEVDYYIVSNQQAIYGEQFGSDTEFINQGTAEPVTISVFHRGKELSADTCPPITLWKYDSVPIQTPGQLTKVPGGITPRTPMTVDVSEPGNFLFTFTVEGETNPPAPPAFPPPNYGVFAYPPAFVVTWAPQISVRVLPNGEDFSQYYVDPTVPDPVGNDKLTFDVVYEKVLKTYYLLFPSMNKVFALNSPKDVAEYAPAILARTKASLWNSPDYMPRTRDMSASRVKLLQAWCRKVMPKK